MKLTPIYNKIIPFEGFYAITLLKWVFIRKEYKHLDGSYAYKEMMNHEGIHFEQEKELGFIFFYILYLLEWLMKLPFYGREAYNNISFEREAFAFEKNMDYIAGRRHYNWVHLIFQNYEDFATKDDINKLFKQ